ncbi:hypothetical protein PybrP1_002104, partial [[Pythium] brassicae (nom. inval.)]
HPTRQWIEDHIESYEDADNKVVDVSGKAFCRSSADCTIAPTSVGMVLLLATAAVIGVLMHREQRQGAMTARKQSKAVMETSSDASELFGADADVLSAPREQG